MVTGDSPNRTRPHDGEASCGLANDCLAIRFGGTGLALTSLEVPGSAQPLQGTAADLYTLELYARDGTRRSIGSSEAASTACSHEGADGEQQLTLRFTHRLDPNSDDLLNVTCHITIPHGSAESAWTLAVHNSSDYAVISAAYPRVALAQREQRPEEPFRYPSDYNVTFTSALLVGFYEGALIPEPHTNIPDGFGWTEEHPGRAAVQLTAYYDSLGGLLVHTRDDVGYPKRIGFRRDGTQLDLGPTHLFTREYGADVSVPYATTLAPFVGDWQTAGEMYRHWAAAQPWATPPLARREDVPDWVKAGYPFVYYAQRRPGSTERADDWEATLPGRMIPVLEAYQGLLDSPLVLMLYAWEKHYSWITPDVFPPYPDTDSVRTLAAALQARGSRICLLNSGTRWAIANPRDPVWDGSEHWEREGRAASCIGEDGEWTYDSRPWAVNHKLCIAAEGTHRVLDAYVAGFADLGIDATQYDQNLGGETYVCYATHHGHPEGYGRWMTDGARQTLQHFLDASRARNPEFATSVEEPNEVLIPHLTLYNGRPYMYHGWPMLTNMLCVGVPLFSYLYHEMTPGYGGDLGPGLSGPETELVKIGRTAAAGYLVQVSLLSPEYGAGAIRAALEAGLPLDTLSLPPALALLKHVSMAQRTYAHDFLVLGRMLRDPDIEVAEVFRLAKARVQSYYNDDRVDYVYPESAAVAVPVILASAWASPSGVPACVFINMSNTPQTVALRWPPDDPAWEPYVTSRLTLHSLDGELPVPPPTAPGALSLDLPALQVSVLRPHV